MSATPSPIPGAARPLHPIRRTIRYWVSRLVAGAVARAWLRFTCEGFDRLPAGPAIYCFNHLSWSDPFVLMATLPMRPRLSFFGPKEEDMGVGGRNRLMHWTGATIPYKPGKNDLLEATRKVSAVIAAGGIVGIAGEGRIGAIESAVLPLNDGPAYFALRSRVPLVPIAINGTSWLRFGGRVRVRVGEPIAGSGRPDRANVAAMTAAAEASLAALVADARQPDRSGRSGAWLSERFNDWPEGSREAALAAQTAGATEPSRVPAAGGQPGVSGILRAQDPQQEQAWLQPAYPPTPPSIEPASTSRATSRSTSGRRR